MNVLDALIALVFLWNLFRGLSEGFVGEVLSLFRLFASFFISYKLTPLLGTFVGSSSKPLYLLIGSFVFLFSFFLFGRLAFLLKSKVHKGPLVLFDGLLGFLLGVLKGALVASLLVFMVSAVSPNSYLVKKSSLGGATVPLVDRALRLVDGKLNIKESWLSNWNLARKYLSVNFNKLKGELLPKSSPKLSGKSGLDSNFSHVDY